MIADEALASTHALPADGRFRPETKLKVIKSPHPVGPTTAQNSPG
jgi:hypothetical protein